MGETLSPRIPLFSLSRHSPYRTDPKALETFYADRRLMWRNVVFIAIANLGWGLVFGIVTNLMRKKLLDLGVTESIQGAMNGINGWAVMFLVMLFSWMSDHTISRVGRRNCISSFRRPLSSARWCCFRFLRCQSLSGFCWPCRWC